MDGGRARFSHWGFVLWNAGHSSGQQRRPAACTALRNRQMFVGEKERRGAAGPFCGDLQGRGGGTGGAPAEGGALSGDDL